MTDAQLQRLRELGDLASEGRPALAADRYVLLAAETEIRRLRQRAGRFRSALAEIAGMTPGQAEEDAPIVARETLEDSDG